MNVFQKKSDLIGKHGTYHLKKNEWDFIMVYLTPPNLSV